MRLKILLLTCFSILYLSSYGNSFTKICLDTIPRVKRNVPILAAGPSGSVNHPPIINNIPDQVISAGDTFPKLDLNNFLDEPNNDPVDWSYYFSNELSNDENPSWSVNPSNFAYSMTMTVRMRVRDTFPDASGHKLAAFHDGELRGVVSANAIGPNWIFYLTIYSNQANDSISFRYYHQDHSSVFMVDDSLKFVSQKNIGNTDNPYYMNAGFLKLEQNASILCPQIIDPDSMWSDTVYVVATENGTTQNFSTTSRIIYRVGDNPSLPVDLVYFSGKKQNQDALLEWEIANPDNFRGFEIQRANRFSEQSELEWMPISFEEHLPEQYHYQYLDESANVSDNYYRLKMIDYDNSYEYSNIINISFGEQAPFTVNFFPNPVAHQLFHMEIETKSPSLINLKVINANGQVMLSQDMESGGIRELIPIDISQLNTGVYWAHVKIGTRVEHKCFSVIRE